MQSTNSLPNDESLALTNLKAFADDKFNVALVMISVFDRVGNTVLKGENAGYSIFSFFQFSKDLFIRAVKTRGCLGNG